MCPLYITDMRVGYDNSLGFSARRWCALFAATAVLAGCGGGPAPPPVSDTVYTAPGDPRRLAASVGELARTCWPTRSEELAALTVLALPDEAKGHPTVRLVLRPASAQASTPPTTVFSVGFRDTGTSLTELNFSQVPEDQVLAQQLKDDVLLWANGSKACI